MRVWQFILILAAALPGAEKHVPRKIHAMVPMRDGVRLATQVFVPGRDKGRLPAILERTPYGKATDPFPNYSTFVENGYAVVVQDVRGRYGSEGSFDPLRQEGPDGYDTLEWIARQSWSNGKVGMIGGSYRGIAQWKAALTNNSHLKAIFPVVSGWDDYRDRFYSSGGAMKLGHRLAWMSENLQAPGYRPDFQKYVLHLPLRTADVAATGWPSRMYRDAIAHPAYDSFWRALSVRERIALVKVPVFAVGGWYDNYAQSDLEAFDALRTASPVNRVLIGPWPHSMSYAFPEASFGPDSGAPIRALQIAWFDRWLKGKESAVAQVSPARLFVMGANEWQDEQDWPPADARPKRLFLTSAGAANSLDGDGVLLDRLPRRSAVASDQFVYDPRDPAPTRGGAVCCNPRLFPWGPMDQRPVERRRDVLVYTSAPLKQDLEVIGPVEVVLWVSTTAKDTDFTAKLVDVFPDGQARNLTDGILRLRYRDSLEKPELAVPGQVYRISVDAGVTANAFLKGHSVRVEISSSNFPRFDRNPNTGGVIADETRQVKATQTIYHDRERPSQVVLMAMPGKPESAVSASSVPTTLRKNLR